MHEEDRDIRAYLLGNLDEESRGRIAGRVLTDENFHDLVLSAETDLLDAYARDELPEPERSLLAARLADSRGLRERLEAARALQEFPVESDTLSRGAFAGWLSGPGLLVRAAALILAAGLGAWWLIGPTSSEPVSVLLFPHTVRGEGSVPGFSLSQATPRIRLQLALEDSPEGAEYSVSLFDPEGTRLLEVGDLTPLAIEGGSVIEVTLEASRLSRGEHEIRLRKVRSGGNLEPTASYFLEVSE